MTTRDYYLGLDMGTSSVGWAITDTEYNLIRKKGKDLWGIREFDEAKTAAERRSYRVSRRRRQREKTRINLLRCFFAEAIDAVDPSFFHRLDNSKYYLEDKDEDVRTPNGVFNDKDYKDRDYFKQFPTVFHLRKELIENNNAPYDVRLVYLAISNMFKHRGHFLNAGLNDDGGAVQIDKAFEDFTSLTSEILDISVEIPNASELTEILTARNLSKTQKTEKLMSLLGIDKKQKVLTECCKAICGRSVDIKKIFLDLELGDKLSFSFSNYDDDTEDKMIKAVGDDRYRLVTAMKIIYDAGLLANILGEYEYLSFARVASFEKHKKDLAVLKKCINMYGTDEQFEEMFRSNVAGSYGAYVNSMNSGKKQRREMKNRKQSDFYDYVKKQINNYPDSEVKQYILTEIEKESFMPKQLTASNGVIPNQVHTSELKMILKNSSEYLPFLNEKDEKGLTVAQKIVMLFSFQIPYYVGPVSEHSEKNGGNGWVVRKEGGAVLPWNIDEKIDMDETRKRFISRLVRECTYLNGEKVLPKASLIYQKYSVLNEINNIKIDGAAIPVELKQDVFTDLFEKGKKVTRNQLCKYLKERGCIKEKEQLSGVDVNVNNSLSSYGKCKAILGDVIDTDKGKEMAEDIIYLCTVYGESKKFLKKQLESRYPELTGKQIDRIIGLRFKDWGRLSKAFLCMEGVEKGTGEVRTIINALWETNCNLMELLAGDKFTYRQSLEESKKNIINSLSDITPESLDEFYFSAPVKKMINQTIKVIREAEKVMGCPPKRVFIEMTRSDDAKGDLGRKDSRKKQLIELYKVIRDESRDWIALIENEDQTGRLKSKKMYLYITQMGRDMYTGEPIDIDDLFDDNKYDVDHIYPRHFVKDDSIHNNLVLVNKSSNAHKSDSYPIEASIRNNSIVSGLWKYLKDSKLITEEKYRRLISSKQFTDDQKSEFIARQIVETGQGTKAVADFLRQAMPESTIVYSKASNVTYFREEFKLFKSRIINEFHHANDAYLNIVVGNVYYTKFTQNPRNYIRNDYKHDTDNSDYNLGKMFSSDVIRNGEIAWLASSKDKPGTISTVRRVMARNTPIMTRQSFCGHGGIADQTLYSKNKARGDGYIPLKTTKDYKLSDVRKYGGFNKAATSYFCLVEHTVKKKRVRSIEAVPIYLAEKIKADPAALKVFLSEQQGLKDISIRIARIPMQSKMRLNGFDVYLSGKTGNQLVLRSAVNLCLEYKWIRYIKKLDDFKRFERLSPEIDNNTNVKLYEELLHKNKEEIYARRQNPIGDKLQKGFDKFKKLSTDDQCRVLIQILRLCAVGADSQADLTLLGYSKQTGTLKTNKDISGNKQCLLISSSAIGINERATDLLKV